MSVHVLLGPGSPVQAPYVRLGGPLWLFCWPDELWYEFRVRPDARGVYRIIQTLPGVAAPTGSPTELPFIVLDDALWWTETGPVNRYHRHIAQANSSGFVTLVDQVTLWALPGGLTVHYPDGLALRSGLYLMRAEDRRYYKWIAKPRASDGLVVLHMERSGATPPF